MGTHHLSAVFFDDRSDLVRVLAHKLGHALGLGHYTNPGSIISQEYRHPGLAELTEFLDVCLLEKVEFLPGNMG